MGIKVHGIKYGVLQYTTIPHLKTISISGKHHHRFAGTTSREPGLDFLPALQAPGAVSLTPGLKILCAYIIQH